MICMKHLCIMKQRIRIFQTSNFCFLRIKLFVHFCVTEKIGEKGKSPAKIDLGNPSRSQPIPLSFKKIIDFIVSHT